MKTKIIVLLGVIACASAAFRTCDRKMFAKVGCYARNQALLPDMILNGREVTAKYLPEDGLISWEDYNSYIHSLACECAEKAKEQGYKYFGIGFYGECFAGKNVGLAGVLAKTPISDLCIRGDYTACEKVEDGSHECVGGANAEYIYTIQEQAAQAEQRINGGYGKWAEWTQCDQECGEGMQFRERGCNNPIPSGGGDDCEALGDAAQSRKCMLKECPVDGGYSRWSEYGKCSASCGGGVMKRTRTCTNPEPSNGGQQCEGKAEETQACGMDPCPVDGGFSQWSKYGQCTLTCGGGLRVRERSCTKPSPAHGGKDCDGLTQETESCNSQSCPVDGVWSSWGSYGACSKDCGYGIETRMRTCTNPAPQHNGKGCEGSAKDTRACYKKACPVNGKWSAWSSYTSCSKSCKGGQKSRTRSCTNPAPAHNGRSCSGSTKEIVDCNQNVRCPYYTAYHTNHVCEGGNMRMWCTDKHQVIKLSEYWYGRTNTNTCKKGINWFWHWKTACKGGSNKVHAACQNKNSCTVYANNSWMGGDPCKGTPKYYYVKFRCYG